MAALAGAVDLTQGLKTGKKSAYNTRGSAIEQSRFESSPGRSKRSEFNSKEQDKDQSENLIKMAMKIMGDCEIEMKSDTKEQMQKVKGDSSHVLE